MSDDEVQRLSEQDIALMRKIVKWRRANGTVFFIWRKGQGFAGAYGWSEWTRRAEDGRRHNVAFERETPSELIFTTDYHRRLFLRIEVDSFGQAVDVLVAYGVLPARFSSAYRAGWDARESYDPCDGLSPEALARLGASLPDIPAVGVA